MAECKGEPLPQGLSSARLSVFLGLWLRWWRAIRVKCPGIAQELERKAVPKVFRWSFAVCSIFVPFLFHEVFQYCFTKAQFIYNIESVRYFKIVSKSVPKMSLFRPKRCFAFCVAKCPKTFKNSGGLSLLGLWGFSVVGGRRTLRQVLRLS